MRSSGIRSDKLKSDLTRSHQSRSDQIGSDQIRSDQMRSDQIGSKLAGNLCLCLCLCLCLFLWPLPLSRSWGLLSWHRTVAGRLPGSVSRSVLRSVKCIHAGNDVSVPFAEPRRPRRPHRRNVAVAVGDKASLLVSLARAIVCPPACRKLTQPRLLVQINVLTADARPESLAHCLRRRQARRLLQIVWSWHRLRRFGRRLHTHQASREALSVPIQNFPARE
jgi:hypothetical protein